MKIRFMSASEFVLIFGSEMVKKLIWQLSAHVAGVVTF